MVAYLDGIPVEEESCNHHWVIEPANGPISTGVCQVCDEAREFRNSIDEPKWGYQRVDRRTP